MADDLTLSLDQARRLAVRPALAALASFAGVGSVSYAGPVAFGVSLAWVSRPGGRAGRRPGEEGPGSTGQGGR